MTAFFLTIYMCLGNVPEVCTVETSVIAWPLGHYATYQECEDHAWELLNGPTSSPVWHRFIPDLDDGLEGPAVVTSTCEEKDLTS